MCLTKNIQSGSFENTIIFTETKTTRNTSTNTTNDPRLEKSQVASNKTMKREKIPDHFTPILVCSFENRPATTSQRNGIKDAISMALSVSDFGETVGSSFDQNNQSGQKTEFFVRDQSDRWESLHKNAS